LQTSRTGHGCAIVHVNFVPHLVVAGGRSIGPQEMPLMLRQITKTKLLVVYAILFVLGFVDVLT
jgi:hypothetical protein